MVLGKSWDSITCKQDLQFITGEFNKTRSSVLKLKNFVFSLDLCTLFLLDYFLGQGYVFVLMLYLNNTADGVRLLLSEFVVEFKLLSQ